MKKCWVIMSVVLLVGVFSVSNSFGASPIKLGAIYSLTGAAALYGQPMLKGVNVAVNEINKAGGILGRTVEVIARDNKSTSNEAARAARELIIGEKVDFLIGTNMTPCGMAISEVAKERKVLFVDVGIKSAVLTEEGGHRYVFTVCSDDAYEGGAMAVLESKTPYKNYWAIGWDYVYCRNMYDSFIRKLKEVKPDAKIVGTSWTKVGETELTPFITRILSSEANAIFSTVMGVSFAPFIKQGKPYGLFEKMHVINGVLVGNPEFLEGVGKDCPDGIVCNAWYREDYPDSPENRAWTKHYINMTGEKYAPAGAVQGYIGATVLFEAIRRAGTTDTEKVIDTMETAIFDTPRAKGIKFRKWDHKSTLGDLWGETKYDPNLGYAVLSNTRYISTEGLSRTEDEVKARRAAKGGKQ